MCVEKLVIKSNIKNYDIYFEKNDSFLQELGSLENVVFVIDANVWQFHKTQSLKYLPKDKTIILPIDETKKNLQTVEDLYEKIMKFAPRKNLTLVSVGGGILQDITGFAASSLYRGINWIFVPTTLLAQVDSCIGAKTSLNFKKYKNLIGTFYPPNKVYIYPEFLKTLTEYDYYSGVGEMAKLHLMSGKDDTLNFVKNLSKIAELDNKTLLDFTQRCLSIKKSYIEDDEFDMGKRNMLNYGHCIGHAVESSTDFAISHGQAVVLGMIIANIEAKKRTLLSTRDEQYFREEVLMPIFKTDMSKIKLDIEKTIAAMGQDKKNTGAGLALVMIADNHKMVKITDFKIEDARTLLEEVNYVKN